MTRALLLCAAGIALAGCGAATGLAVDLDIDPGCAAGATALEVHVTARPSGRESHITITLAAAPIFPGPGGHRRLVILPPEGTEGLTIALRALASGSEIGNASVEVVLSGPARVEQKVQLASCIAPDLATAIADLATNDAPTDLAPDSALPVDAAPDLAAPDLLPLAAPDLAASDAPAADAAPDLDLGLALAPIDQTAPSDLAVAKLIAISITPPNPQLPKGNTLQLTATGTYSDNSTKDLTLLAAWTSTDDATATVQKGLLTGIKPGPVLVKAIANGVTGQNLVAVTAATLSAIVVAPGNPSVAKGTSTQFIATGLYSDNSSQDISSSVTWTSTDPVAASISNQQGQKGIALALGPGKTTISASQGNQLGSTTLTVTAATLDTIAVTPAMPSIAKGTTVEFQATGTYSDNSIQDLTPQVTWQSDSGAVATIDKTGLASAVSVGTTKITASFGMVAGSTVLTINAATLVSMAVKPQTASIAKGTSLHLEAIGTYSDTSTQNLTSSVTWSSSDEKIVVVSNAGGSQGQATGSEIGMATLGVAQGNVTAKAMLTVTNATLKSVAVTPGMASIAKGTTQQYLATGTYSDMSTQDLTTQVTWTCSDGTVATVSNTAPTHGLATTTKDGLITITATPQGQGMAGTATLNVKNVSLTAITVAPASVSVPKGLTQQYKATGTFSDNSKQEITELASWLSHNGAVATISNSAGTRGLATVTGVGITTLQASKNNIIGTATITGTAALLLSITVTPADSLLAALSTQQYTATGSYTDKTMPNLTRTVAWASSDPTVATIVSVVNGATTGLATAKKAGTCKISAALSGKTGETGLSVK
ncbi:MAG: ATP-dependent DNA ligase [Myxococcales bacterium]|nr:ATP-dependent DNA ligase [Myxococcales bacterium]